MKITHLLGLLIIAAAIGVMISASADFSTYSNFAEAMSQPDKTHKVVGDLEKAMPMEYDPAKNANYFSFYIRDKKGVTKKVVYQGAKPQDFERSEEIVFQGSMKGAEFIATSLQLKCPSKYEDGKVKTYSSATN